MGSYYQSIVFPDVPREAAEHGGREILNCLQELGIVESELSGDTLNSGYPPGPNWRDAVINREATSGFLTLRINGLTVDARPNVYFSNARGIRCRCPVCKADQSVQYFDTEYLPGLDVWARNNGSHPLLCQGCNVSSEMTFWTTWHPEFVDDPPFAVSYLGLTFWNWPELARPRFDEFGVTLGSRVVYQYRKL
jgi:hypothetical protein